MGYRFRISLVNSCNVCRDVSRKHWPCREQTRDQLLRAQHSAASFSSSAAWFTSAAKWTDTKLTGELQVFSLKSSPETCLGRRSHAEDPPLHEACLPSLSTRNVTDIDMEWHGHRWSSRSGLDKCFWTCNAAQHVFCTAIPKQEIIMVHVDAFEQSSWACAAMRWLCCLSWGCLSCNYFSMSKWVDSFLTCSSCNLFFSFCKRVQSCLNLKAPNHWQVNYCHIALVTGQAAATTVSVVPGMTFSGKVLLNERSSCSRICDLDSRDLHYVLLLDWYEHPNHKLHACVLFASCNTWEYLIPLSQIVLTCSNPSHSPEDAVILIVLRRMSLSTPVFSRT